MITEYAQAEADFDHEFEKRTWSMETVKVLKAFIAFIRKQLGILERAYGNCHECYGKGFSTQQGRHPDGSAVRKMNFCGCERGMQLKIYWNETHGQV